MVLVRKRISNGIERDRSYCRTDCDSEGWSLQDIESGTPLPQRFDVTYAALLA